MMKRFNVIYLLPLLLILALFQLFQKYDKNTVMFYGFAENKETDINLDQDVQVNALFVTPGQSVITGESLVEVSRLELDEKIQGYKNDLNAIQDRTYYKRSDVEAKITSLELDKKAKRVEVENEIQLLQNKLDRDQRIIEQIESIDISAESSTSNPSYLKIENLKDALSNFEIEIDAEIKRYRLELSGISNESNNQRKNIENKIQYFEEEQNSLTITAPYNGVIGTISCKAGEHVPSFSPIISFYNERPTMVKGYVHESLILEVSIGDSLIVSSSLHGEHQTIGVVVGLGSRIIEIPGRLRKMQDHKTYGREVLISISSENNFLQKEKVILNKIVYNNSQKEILSSFKKKSANRS